MDKVIFDAELRCIEARMSDPDVSRMADEVRRLRMAHDRIHAELIVIQETMQTAGIDKSHDNESYDMVLDLLDCLVGWVGNSDYRWTREGASYGETS